MSDIVSKASEQVLTTAEIRDISLRALVAAGATEANAAIVADSIVAGEADGLRLIGLDLLAGYCRHPQSGRIDGRATPRLRMTRPGAVTIDAANGFAHVALEAGRAPLIAEARTSGVAALTVANAYSAGILGHFVEPIAAAGLVALAVANAPAVVAPWGGTTRLFGTNPIAFAAPRAAGPPLVIDQATSAVTVVEFLARAEAGGEIPDGWLRDAEGDPTTDPAAFSAGGSLAPAGGHRGAMLALAVDLLAAGLSGANWSFQAAPLGTDEGGPPGLGQLVVALDPGAFAPGFTTRVEALCAAILAQPGARLPGERRLRAREAVARDGVRVPPALHRELLALADGA